MTIVSPPPRVFHAILQMVLSADGVGDEIARDLGDEFERDFREVGRRIAGARYRRRVVEVALYYVWDHVRGRTWARGSQGRPSPAPQRDLGTEPRRRLNTLVESLHTLHNDVRIAVRMLVKRPGFAAILTVTIAVTLEPTSRYSLWLTRSYYGRCPSAIPNEWLRFTRTRR